MTSIRINADITVYCDTCGNDISNHAREGRAEEVYVEPCENCIGKKESTINDLMRETDTLNDSIYLLEQKIKELEEQLNPNT